MSSKSIYCTYLTTYLGNKMPMFYIGSASMKRIENGYHGSISSKLYSTVYKEELLSNPHLLQYQNGSHNSQIKYKCQHCCKVGFGSTMKRYHLDNCKLNECNEHNVIGSYEPINKKLKHLTCPHCGVIGSGINNMKRYHFDNCKHRS